MLFGVIPALLLAVLGSITVGLFGFLEGSVFKDTAPVAILTLLIGYGIITLRHDILVAPHSIRSEEWSALWVLGARNGLHSPALSIVRRLAELRLDESVRRRAHEFSVEMQLALDDLESAFALVPPTSPGEYTDQEEAA